MKDQLVFEKNENYWNKDSIKLDKLTFKLVTDDTTAQNYKQETLMLLTLFQQMKLNLVKKLV